jgi:hypothetical protein
MTRHHDLPGRPNRCGHQFRRQSELRTALLQVVYLDLNRSRPQLRLDQDAKRYISRLTLLCLYSLREPPRFAGTCERFHPLGFGTYITSRRFTNV